MSSPELLESVKRHEGYRSRAYQDSLGVWTIGWGTNLQELEVDSGTATLWLLQKLKESATLAGGFPWWNDLNGARKDVIVEMIYNMGLPRFGGFKMMLRALADKNFDKAAAEMLDSKWAAQVGKRADRLAQQMLSGEYAAWNA